MVFDTTVHGAIEGSMKSEGSTVIATNRDRPAIDPGQPLPPNDPLGEIGAHAAADYTFAGATNGIWKAFLKGEKIYKALEGWDKTREALTPHVIEVLGWLRRLISVGDGIANSSNYRHLGLRHVHSRAVNSVKINLDNLSTNKNGGLSPAAARVPRIAKFGNRNLS